MFWYLGWNVNILGNNKQGWVLGGVVGGIVGGFRVNVLSVLGLIEIRIVLLTNPTYLYDWWLMTNDWLPMTNDNDWRASTILICFDAKDEILTIYAKLG